MNPNLLAKSLLFVALASIILLSGCDQKEKEKSLTESGMNCGAGKCGASMVNGSALLVKKKMNILNQLREDDTRRACVRKANTTKALYACVRSKKTGRLSTKCSSDNSLQIPKKKPQ